MATSTFRLWRRHKSSQWCYLHCLHTVTLLHTNIYLFMACYFAHGSGGDVLWWACLCVCVCLCVCLSVHEDVSGTTCAIFTNFSVPVAYGHGSVLLQHSYEIPRGRGSFGGFPPHWQCIVRCLLQKEHSVANNVMQQKGSFCYCSVHCKIDNSITAGKGVMGVNSMGEVWSTIALFLIVSVSHTVNWFARMSGKMWCST